MTQVVSVYEAIVFNSIYDLDNVLLPKLMWIGALLLMLQLFRPWRRFAWRALLWCLCCTCFKSSQRTHLEARHWLGTRGAASERRELLSSACIPLTQVTIKGE